MSELVPLAATPAAGVPLALFGGPASGKSFLFQAMVHRCQSRRFAGALTPLLGRGAITVDIDGSARNGLQTILREYAGWQTLGSTLHDRPSFYRLSLPYSSGWLGRSVSRLRIELPDLAGEIYVQGNDGPSAARWNALAVESRVLIFCLPFWAVFPAAKISDETQQRAKMQLDAYERVVNQVMAARKAAGAEPPLILVVLTMADDRRCGLAELRDIWLPDKDLVEPLLVRLRNMRSLMAYLQDARKISDYLRTCFEVDPERARLIELLEDQGHPSPWILPVSAVDGRVLERDQQQLPPPGHPPMPIHVELPLLLALCEQTRALV
jgi:hypothetical protein